MTPLQSKYSNVVMGYDFHGPTVDVSVDLQAYTEMDDFAVDALSARTLRAWVRAWRSAHPHDHATLTVRFLDFRANLITKESARV